MISRHDSRAQDFSCTHDTGASNLCRAQELHAAALAATRRIRSDRRELCLLLARIDGDRLYRALGFPSLADYAEAELAFKPRTARAMALLGRRLPELPALDAALAAGELSWTKARTLLAVALPESEADWVERAAETTTRELELQVADCLPGDPPPHPVHAAELAAFHSVHRLSFNVDDQARRLICDGLATLRAATGLSKEELSDGALLGQLVQRALAEVDGDAAPTGQRYVIALQQCADCGATAGLEAPASHTHAHTGSCDPLVVDMRSGPDQGRQTSAIPPKLRRFVLTRDRRACVNPRCTNTLWLDQHHIDFRRDGGANTAENLCCLCSACHEALHDGNMGLEHTDQPGVVAFRWLDGAVVRVRLGVGPIDEVRGPRGPGRRERASWPTGQQLLAFGTRGVRRVGGVTASRA